ncbi:putative carboxypeptidase PM20D1-like protein, partial [Leptotrombidium deliense]
MSFFTRILLFLFLLFFATLTICVFRALVYFRPPKDAELCGDNETHKAIKASSALYERFARALKIETVTRGEHKYDKDALISIREFLEKTFPRIHSSSFIKREIISEYSLLYTIKGSDASLKPYMLCSHLDVVPVEIDKWSVDPFGGQIKNGYIYGRGTIDLKDTLMAIMESLEFLLENGFKPKRSFYLAFGHDEEGSGVEGAAAMTKIIKSRTPDLEYLLDEGSVIVNRTFKGVKPMVAVVGVTEKGYLTLKMNVTGAHGHSSLAPYETSIVTLSKAITKLHANAFPSRFGSGIEKDIFELLAPYAEFPYKLAFSNLWLFGPLVSYLLSSTPVGNSLIRTSTAVTMIEGGFKANVLPSSCYAMVNHRIHPAESIAEVIEYDRRLINDDPKFEPHPISPYDENAFGFQAVRRSIREVFANIVVVPGIMLASTDTKYYLDLTKNIYRFSPVIMTPEEFKLFHGHNERISLKNYLQIVNFYHHLM